jgi:hypothetical protein
MITFIRFEVKSDCLLGMLNTILFIPVTLEVAALLAALTHPNHLVRLSSWTEFLCRLTATPMALCIDGFKKLSRVIVSGIKWPHL